MACQFPRDIYVKKQLVFNKDSGRWQYGYESHSYKVPCGKCPGCLRDRQNEFAFRLVCESRVHKYAYFVTLTYSDKYLPDDKCLHKEDFQQYIKRLKFLTPLQSYYLCGEYGSKHMRPHAHCILYYDLPQNCDFCYDRKTGTINEDLSPSPFSVCWSPPHNGKSQYESFGRCDIKPFSPARAGYVCKYSVKQLGLNYNGLTPPFCLFSKGIGLQGFLNSDVSRQVRDTLQSVVIYSGGACRLPRYFKQKLFDYGSDEWHQIQFNNMQRVWRAEDEQKRIFGDSYYSSYYERFLNKSRAFNNNLLSQTLTTKFYGNSDQ